jgi:rSAM/selenodomain-associated transferase 2
MKVSVIIPTLNEEGVIGETLEHLSRSREPEIEIIVSDGGSTDGTLEIAGRYARMVSSRPGRGIQMNGGAALATGDILLFLHADTILPKDWGERVISAMSDGRVVGGAFSLSVDSERLPHRAIAAAATLRSRIAGLAYGDQGIFVRREVFEEMGGFRDIPIMEDIDFIKRLKKSGRMVLLKDSVKTSARRWEKEGVVYTTLRNWLLISLYHIGVAPERLYKLYKVIR